MAFAKDTIKLGAAQTIFAGADIQEIRIADRVAGYRATIDGQTTENTSLTALCAALWKSQVKRQKLEAAGWKVGSTADFLELTPDESKIIEMKLVRGRESP